MAMEVTLSQEEKMEIREVATTGDEDTPTDNKVLTSWCMVVRITYSVNLKPDHCSHVSQRTAVYDLTMVVGHVREGWMDTPGNLITHIRVAPSYHIRKGVGITQELYLRSMIDLPS